MIRKSIIALAASLTLLAQPAVAQEEPDEEVFAALAEMFQAEPLTAEQSNRLPLAREIVEKMIPEGTLGEMMGSMFDGMLAPVMEMATAAPRGDVAKQLGVSSSELEMSDEELAELADILDPVRETRNERMAQVMPQMMANVMQVMEPPMRKAMSEAYAVYFTDRELVDIDAFFSTDSGLAFARKSFTMSSDPRIIAGTMEAMPEMMAAFGEMETSMKEATADLPEPRSWADLGSAERARVSELTGIAEGELAAGMAAAAETEAETEE